MIKYFVSCMLLLSCNNSAEKSFTNDIDSTSSKIAIPPPNFDTLSKYSYLLISMNGQDTIGNATGFFIKNNNRLYLISNFHVLTNKNPFTLQPFKDKWDRILIRYNHNSEWSYYSLNLKKLWDTAEIKKPFPVDVFRVEIPGLADKKIYTIDLNNNSLTDENISIGSTTCVYAFPNSDYRNQRDYNKRVAKLFQSTLLKYDNKKLDNINGVFTTVARTQQGCSGAPAFAYSTLNGKAKFLGIIFGSDTSHSNGFRCDIVSMVAELTH